MQPLPPTGVVEVQRLDLWASVQGAYSDARGTQVKYGHWAHIVKPTGEPRGSSLPAHLGQHLEDVLLDVGSSASK
jgi:hypothetical protein